MSSLFISERAARGLSVLAGSPEMSATEFAHRRSYRASFAVDRTYTPSQLATAVLLGFVRRGLVKLYRHDYVYREKGHNRKQTVRLYSLTELGIYSLLNYEMAFGPVA